MTTDTDTPKTEFNGKYLPLQPLWLLAQDKCASLGYAKAGMSVAEFAEMVGYNVKAIHRWRQQDAIPWVSADRAAVNLGYHPVNVWNMDWLNINGDYAKIASGALDGAMERAWVKAKKEKAAAGEPVVAEEPIEPPVHDDEWMRSILSLSADEARKAEALMVSSPEMDILP